MQFDTLLLEHLVQLRTSSLVLQELEKLSQLLRLLNRWVISLVLVKLSCESFLGIDKISVFVVQEFVKLFIVLVCKCLQIQVCKFLPIQVCKCFPLSVCKRLPIPVYKCLPIPVCKCLPIQVCKCLPIQVWLVSMVVLYGSMVIVLFISKVIKLGKDVCYGSC